MVKDFIPVTEGAGQDILDALKVALGYLTKDTNGNTKDEGGAPTDYSQTENDSIPQTSSHTDKELLIESTGRKIATVLTELAGALNNLKANTEKADSTLTENLNTEIQDRKDADANIQYEIDGKTTDEEGNEVVDSSGLQPQIDAINSEINGTDDNGDVLSTTIQGQINSLSSTVDTNYNNTVTKGTSASSDNQDIYGTKTFKSTIVGDLKGDVTGNATTATKLATAKTIQTNLASTDAASFDGSANITPGISGVLPIANGGTGNEAGQAASVANSLSLTLNGDETTYNGANKQFLSWYAATKPIYSGKITLSTLNKDARPKEKDIWTNGLSASYSIYPLGNSLYLYIICTPSEISEDTWIRPTTTSGNNALIAIAAWGSPRVDINLYGSNNCDFWGFINSLDYSIEDVTAVDEGIPWWAVDNGDLMAGSKLIALSTYYRKVE